MVMALLLAGLIAEMLFAPETPAARWLHGTMVEECLRLAEGLERRHLIFLVIGLFAIEAFALALPADLAVLAVWDVALYVDVMIATWTLSTVARFRSMKALAAIRIAALLAPFRRFRTRARRNRLRRPDARKPAANDDDPVPVTLRAAA